MARQVPPIDDDIYTYVQSQAIPLEDDFNSVLRRLLGLESIRTDGAAPPGASPGRTARHSRRKRGTSARARGPRAVKGSLLAEEEYERPILEALVQLGGRGPTREVIDLVGQELDGRLTATDREELASGDVRWRNRAQFVRLALIKRGDMKPNSPRGVWEITEQGARRARGASS